MTRSTRKTLASAAGTFSLFAACRAAFALAFQVLEHL